MRRGGGLAWGLGALLSVGSAAESKPAPSVVDYAGQDWIVEWQERKLRLEDDGTGQEEEARRVRILTEAGVRSFGQLVKPYNSALDQIEFHDVRVRKPDGSVVAAPLNQAVEVTAPVVAAFPVYSDLRLKHLPVRDLRPGDVLEYAVTRTIKVPVAAGQFWVTHSFDSYEIVLDEAVEISVPLNRPLKLRTADGVTPAISEAAGRRTYRFRHKTTQVGEVAATRRRAHRQVATAMPDVALSTIQSWEDLAVWYQGLTLDRGTPTPEIREKAATLTKGLHDDLARIEAIYDFVATRVRYVSVSLGEGALRPRAAADTLASGYGDCKDKHTLLAALLAAVGISADAALISVTGDVDPAVPYLQFDHVISAVTVGSEYLWLDATTEVAPFRWLWPRLSTLVHKSAHVFSLRLHAAVSGRSS